METRERSARFGHIDGLRGIAVLMVVIHNAWLTSALTVDHNTVVGRLIGAALGEGEQGVSLFLVISGFCLAYPALRRRARGDARWLNIREFAARRVYRIIPPYYAALGIFSILALAFEVSGAWPFAVSMNAPATLRDVLSHALLIQNVTTRPYTINAAFWSLGLEWQWYFVFPLLVLAYVRAPRLTLGVCACMALFWGGILPELLRGDELWTFRLWLPARLFEFSLGIASAALLVQTKPVNARRGLVFAAGGGVIVLLLHLIGQPLLALLLWGPIWAGVLLLSFAVPSVQRSLSIRPLARLGLVSYSVYLIHQPVTELVNVAIGTNRLGTAAGLGAIALASAAGIAAGVLFFTVVERPLLDPRTWERFGPHLLRWFGAVSAPPPTSVSVAVSNAE